MIRKRPTAQWQAKTGVSGASHDNYYSYLDVGGPLAFDGRLRGRTVMAYRDSQSFRDNYALQREVGYGILEADLTDDTVVAVGFDYQNKHVQGSSWGTLPYWNSDGSKARLSRSANLAADWSSWPLKDKTTFASIDHTLATDWRLKAAYTHRQSDTDGKVYYGGAGFPNADGSGMTAWTNQMVGTSKMDVVDFNLAGTYALLGREHALMLGYGESEQRDTSPFQRFSTPQGYETIEDWKHMGGIGKFPDRTTGLKGEHSSKKQKAGYLATRLSLTDTLHAVLGSRYGSWEIESASPTYNLDNQLTASSKSSQTHTDMWTPYAGLLYDLTPEYTVYASYTDIFNPQSSKDLSGKVLEPIVGENYEVGIKGEYFNGALNASLAVFQIDQKNRATTAATQAGCPVLTCYAAAGLVRSQGIDLELQGALTENWQVGGGFTYTRAHFIKDSDPANDNQRFSSDTPERLFKLTTSYRFQGPLEKLRIGGNVYWQSRMYNDIALTNGSYRLEQGSYAVADVMAGYQVNQHLDLQVNANNIFDRTYYSAIGNSTIWGSTDTYGNPRSFGVTAKYSF